MSQGAKMDSISKSNGFISVTSPTSILCIVWSAGYVEMVADIVVFAIAYIIYIYLYSGTNKYERKLYFKLLFPPDINSPYISATLGNILAKLVAACKKLPLFEGGLACIRKRKADVCWKRVHLL